MRPLSPKFHARIHRLQESLPAAMARRFFETDLLAHAAALSFYALLSLAPLLVLLLFVGATAVFARLQTALNLIFHSDARRFSGVGAWLRKRLFSLGVVFALGFLLLVSMTLTTALQVAFARIPSLLPMLGNLLSLALYALAFAFLYHYLPDRRVRWRQALLGGGITAALFALGRWAIGLYLAEAAPGSAYGSMGALVLLLAWMYYAAAVFFLGALATAVIDERAGPPEVPPAVAS